MNHKKLERTLLALTLALASFGSQAGVIYEWVCDDATCNGDPTFTSTMEISNSAFAAGSFTGVTGNILSWDTTSGVGDGFMVDLADIESFTGTVGDDFNNVMIALSADGFQILDLFDISQGTLIGFTGGFAQGNVFWREGANGSYFVHTRQDNSPSPNIVDQTQILGIFVRVVSVPEPTTLSLLAAGLIGFGLTRRRRRVA